MSQLETYTILAAIRLAVARHAIRARKAAKATLARAPRRLAMI